MEHVTLPVNVLTKVELQVEIVPLGKLYTLLDGLAYEFSSIQSKNVLFQLLLSRTTFIMNKKYFWF